jgi:hypothetical protein
MPQYLKFNIRADQVCITPQSTYFKIDADSHPLEVFVSEDYFPLLTKILEKDGDLSELLAFECYGGHFVQSIIDTVDNCNLIDDEDMAILFEKYLSWIAWPCKHDDLLNEWQEDAELQYKFPDVNEFISDKRSEEIFSVSEIWEISHGKKIDLTQESLSKYSAGGWALDGSYLEEANRFVAFANISKIQIELIDGVETKALTEAELKKMLLNQYAGNIVCDVWGNEIENLEPEAEVDRGLLIDKYRKERLRKRKVRLIKITILVSIFVVYLSWMNGYF